MSDFYEDTNGLDKNNGADAHLDSDDDGATNLEEYKASTRSNDSSSILDAELLADTESSELRVQWASVPRLVYVVEESVSLLSDSWTAVEHREPIQATSSSTQLTLPARNGGKKFYRVRVAQ